MANVTDEFKDNPEVQAALEKVLALLAKHPLVCEYREITQKIDDHPTLFKLTDEIKTAQKDAVQFAHYDKPEAEKAALAKADDLTAQFDQHPLVVRYREVLFEVNELLQYLTKKFERAFNVELANQLASLEALKN